MSTPVSRSDADRPWYVAKLRLLPDFRFCEAALVRSEVRSQISAVRGPLSVVQQGSVQQLDRQKLVDFDGVVSQPIRVSVHQRFQRRSV